MGGFALNFVVQSAGSQKPVVPIFGVRDSTNTFIYLIRAGEEKVLH